MHLLNRLNSIINSISSESFIVGNTTQFTANSSLPNVIQLSIIQTGQYLMIFGLNFQGSSHL